ncbi:MAG: MBL fold metallo-hydrolase [Proteobacteria bacterium]|nr:MBL fold metallo-hydrolase [Pseudomonadota bacterium]
MSHGLRFLGVGNAAAIELGSSSVVLEREQTPLLMIDCGQEALTAHLDHYQASPKALFITHVHMDHVAGMERLFIRAWFDEALRGRLKLYVPVKVLPHLQSRVADYPGALAEGTVNFWDAFQVIPVANGFWHEGLWFDVFPVRHHLPETAYGLRLRGSFVYTGDTRPVPEMLAFHADAGEIIVHDCALHGNPSHTGVEDLEREYPSALQQRMLLYHYESATAGQALVARGHRIAHPGQVLALPTPLPPVTGADWQPQPAAAGASGIAHG